MLASSKSGKPTQLTRTKDTVKTGVLECQTMGCGQSTVAPAALEHEMPQHSEVKTPVLQEENTAATVATNSPQQVVGSAKRYSTSFADAEGEPGTRPARQRQQSSVSLAVRSVGSSVRRRSSVFLGYVGDVAFRKRRASTQSAFDRDERGLPKASVFALAG